MSAINVLQKNLERLPIRGKGRLADLIFRVVKPAEVECHPIPGVTVVLNPAQRIERLMWAGTYEPELVGLFKRILRPGMTAIDVGANVGYFSTIAAALVGKEGHLYAFEPIPACFAQLRRNLSLFPWSYAYSRGVGDVSGTATIHFNDRELGWGSLLNNGDLNRALAVPLITLDDWASQEGIRSLHFIKMDAEGSEYRVLKGAERVLRELRPIVATELNSVCLERDGRTPADAVGLLKAAEYLAFSFNEGVLAIPREADHALSSLRKYTKKPFVG